MATFVFSGHTPSFSDVFLRYDKQLSLKILKIKSVDFFSVCSRKIYTRETVTESENITHRSPMKVFVFSPYFYKHLK